jgi:hypothetical protein
VKSDKTTVAVPKDDYPKVLALFQTGALDARPKKWDSMTIGLKITTEAGKIIFISLYRTYDGAGAFSIEPTSGERVYYRGSTDEEIDSVVKGIQRR